MFHITKYLKSFLFSIILILGLLYLQAQADLALPDYMSQIVDTGVASNGIEDASPEVMRETTFKKLFLFLNEEDKMYVQDRYTFLSSQDNSTLDEYVKRYPLLASESLYTRVSMSEDELETLNHILARPLLIVAGLEEAIKNPEAASKLPMMNNLPAGMDPYALIGQLPEEQLQGMKSQIMAKFAAMPEATIQAAARSSIKKEYEAIGINMGNYQQQYILRIGGFMLLIALIGSIASIIVSFLASRVAAGFSTKLRQAVFQKVISFSNAEFNEFSTASLITRTTNDIQQVQQILVLILRMVIYAPIIGIGALLKVLKTNVSMSWVIGLAVGIILIIIGTAFLIAFPKFKKIQTLVDRLNLVMREFLSGMLVIRAFNTEKHEEEKFEKANQDITKTNLFVNRLMSILLPAMMFIMSSISLLIVWVGAKQIDMGTLQVGEMMAFLQYAMQIIMSFLMISMISIMLPRAQVAANRISDVLVTPVSIHDPKQPASISSSKASVVFDHVSFRYPGAEEDILHDISFEAKPGEITAFIGSTGSGKSTVINLIPRFFDVTEGSLRINGTDVRDYKQHDLREIIGFVPQKGVLFSGTIESNLKHGKANASKDDMSEAAEIAQAMEFISQKEHGFEEPIAQGGTNVSGGQKQRLSIARAVIKKAPIYIFDDTFSALDFKTESLLRKQLNAMIQKTHSTVFIVAQRINTIMNADQIIVLDRGRIVGKGKHDELMKNCQVYQEIAYSQLSKEELDNE